MPRRKNYYNYGPKKPRSTSDVDDPKPQRDSRSHDKSPRHDPRSSDAIESLMMPGNYLPRRHRTRPMPVRKPRLNAQERGRTTS